MRNETNTARTPPMALLSKITPPLFLPFAARKILRFKVARYRPALFFRERPRTNDVRPNFNSPPTARPAS
jgi:hypothetical protein